MSKIDAARANWRADLCDWNVAVLTEAGDTAAADQEKARSDFHRKYASLMLELADAKESGDPVKLNEAKVKLHAFRQATKREGVPEAVSMSNFEEPSNEQLMIGA